MTHEDDYNVQVSLKMSDVLPLTPEIIHKIHNEFKVAAEQTAYNLSQRPEFQNAKLTARVEALSAALDAEKAKVQTLTLQNTTLLTKNMNDLFHAESQVPRTVYLDTQSPDLQKVIVQLKEELEMTKLALKQQREKELAIASMVETDTQVNTARREFIRGAVSMALAANTRAGYHSLSHHELEQLWRTANDAWAAKPEGMDV